MVGETPRLVTIVPALLLSIHQMPHYLVYRSRDQLSFSVNDLALLIIIRVQRAGPFRKYYALPHNPIYPLTWWLYLYILCMEPIVLM